MFTLHLVLLLCTNKESEREWTEITLEKVLLSALLVKYFMS